MSKNEVLLKIQKRNQAAITIQKIARGYMARKYYKIIRISYTFCIFTLGKRTHIVREILETEQNYCTQLAAVVMLYMRPLQESTPTSSKGLSFLKREPLLEPEQRKTLFSGFYQFFSSFSHFFFQSSKLYMAFTADYKKTWKNVFIVGLILKQLEMCLLK